MNQLLILAADQTNWPKAYHFANYLLKDGFTVYWATQPFQAAQTTFERGTFLITEVPDAFIPEWQQSLEDRFGMELLPVDAVENFAGLHLRAPRIAMYGGGGAPFNHARIFGELGFTVEFISPQEIRQGRLAEFDALGMPGGGGIAMKGQLDPLGEEGCRLITEFVRQGGMYFGSCAGSFDAAIVSDSFLAVCPQQRHMQLVNARVWNRNDTEWFGLNSPGVGVLESRNLRPDHPVMFGLPDAFRITHYNGPFFEPTPGTLPDASDASALSAVAGFTNDYTPSEYFLSFDGYDKAQADASSLVSTAAQESRFNVVAGYNGMGRVVLFGSHPEFGYNLAMDEWEVPARMLANAIFWQAGHTTEAKPLTRKTVQGSAYSIPFGSGLRQVAAQLDTITALVNDLCNRDTSDAEWLSDAFAMSTFGLSGEAIWQRNLATFSDMIGQMQQTIAQTETLVGKISDSDVLLALEEAIHYRTPPEWNQDFGYEGVLQMLERTITMLQKASANFNQTFEPSPNPYQYFDTNPFQLVVGSYLAAVGVFGNALFLLQVHQFRLDEHLFRDGVMR